MRSVVSRFDLVQFGVTVFTELSQPLPHPNPTMPDDAADDTGQAAGGPAGGSGGGGAVPSGFEAAPFNVYVFPGADAKKEVVLSPGAVAFLNDSGMDWQKWIRGGVAFVDSAAEKKLREQYFDSPPGEHPPPPRKRRKLELEREGDKSFVADAMAGLAGWISAGCPTGSHAMPPCAGMLLHVLHQKLDEMEGFEQGYERESRPGEGGRLYVHKRSAERAAEARAERHRRYSSKAGVTQMFDAITASKLPVVGHNVMYDLLFIMHNFAAALPDTLTKFLQQLRARFPTVVDTKFLATYELNRQTGAVDLSPTLRFASTSLGPLYAESKAAETFILASPGFGAYDTCAVAHEAGWDSLATGACLLSIAELLQDGAAEKAPRRAWKAALRSAKNMCFGMFAPWCWNLEPDGNQRLGAWTGGATGAELYVVDGITPGDRPEHVLSLFNESVRGRCKLRWSDDAVCLVTVQPVPTEPSNPECNVDSKDMLALMNPGAKQSAPHLRLVPWTAWISLGGAAMERPRSPSSAGDDESLQAMLTTFVPAPERMLHRRSAPPNNTAQPTPT